MNEDMVGGLFEESDEQSTSTEEKFENDVTTASENNVEELEGGEEGELDSVPSNEQVIIEKNDRSLSEFHRWYGNGRLNIEPEWQRNYVWDNGRASRLIESFLADIPVPVVYLAKTDDNKYEVIDGVQRLTSVFSFFAGKTVLTGLELLPEHYKKG